MDPTIKSYSVIENYRPEFKAVVTRFTTDNILAYDVIDGQVQTAMLLDSYGGISGALFTSNFIPESSPRFWSGGGASQSDIARYWQAGIEFAEEMDSGHGHIGLTYRMLINAFPDLVADLQTERVREISDLPIHFPDRPLEELMCNVTLSRLRASQIEIK